MANEQVLIVDDDPAVLELCDRILSDNGYRTAKASSGQEAVKWATVNSLDLLLTDIVMPGIDGIGTWRAVEAIHPNATGVVITGHGVIETAVDAMKNGFSGFVVKPFGASELLTAVSEALHRRKKEREVFRFRSLLSLFEVSQAITQVLDLRPLLELILKLAVQETGCDKASLMLLEQKTRTLRIWASLGLPAEVVARTAEKLGQGIAGWVAEKGHPLILGGPSEDTSRFAPVMKSQGVASALCLPLVARGQVIGVLNLSKGERKTPFTESDEELISIFSATAAGCIENARLHEKLHQSYFSAIGALAAAVEAKDPFTRGHSDAVSRYAADLAQEMGMDSAEVEGIRVAGLLHDVGKIGISESVLLKRGDLTAEEYEVIKSHPVLGARILEPAIFPWEVTPLVYHHQERFDGRGYPEGLKGEDIPLGARILAVSDTFDALTQKRAYREAVPYRDAIDVLLEVAGTQLDAVIVNAFLDHLLETQPPPTESQS